jgi:hypothetical protein
MRHGQAQHHDRNDDGKHSIAECFHPSLAHCGVLWRRECREQIEYMNSQLSAEHLLADSSTVGRQSTSRVELSKNRLFEVA